MYILYKRKYKESEDYNSEELQVVDFLNEKVIPVLSEGYFRFDKTYISSTSIYRLATRVTEILNTNPQTEKDYHSKFVKILAFIEKYFKNKLIPACYYSNMELADKNLDFKKDVRWVIDNNLKAKKEVIASENKSDLYFIFENREFIIDYLKRHKSFNYPFTDYYLITTKSKKEGETNIIINLNGMTYLDSDIWNDLLNEVSDYNEKVGMGYIKSDEDFEL